jgi:dihydroorotate dehydrogenase
MGSECFLLYGLARRFLFLFDAERAHSIGTSFMRLLPSVNIEDDSLKVKTSFGILRNPLGLAAGFDKTGEHLSTMERLGFGYLVAGTITSEPWPGNPKPRIFRNPKDKTLVNCLGFPNPGVDNFIKNLKKQKLKIPVLGSVSGRTVESIVDCYEKLQPHVAGIEINLSSPNTPKLKDLREIEAFRELAQQLKIAKRKPTYLKIPPISDEDQFRKSTISLVRYWNDIGFDGATVANSLPISDPRLSIGMGGYSGPPLFPKLEQALELVRQNTTEDFEINAVGGISNAKNVISAIHDGAKTTQMYTALIFEGPRIVKQILEGMRSKNH